MWLSEEICNCIACHQYVHKETGKDFYGCVTDNCDWHRAGNAQECRILKHAAHCQHLSANLKLLTTEQAVAAHWVQNLEICNLYQRNKQISSRYQRSSKPHMKAPWSSTSPKLVARNCRQNWITVS